MSVSISRVVADLSQNQFVAQVEQVHEDPVVLSIRRHKGSNLLVLLSDEYAFSADHYRVARRHLPPGGLILLVDEDSNATDEARRAAKHTNSRIVTINEILDLLAVDG